MLIKLSNIRFQNPEKHAAIHIDVSQVSAILQLFYTVHKFYVQNLSTVSVLRTTQMMQAFVERAST